MRLAAVQRILCIGGDIQDIGGRIRTQDGATDIQAVHGLFQHQIEHVDGLSVRGPGIADHLIGIGRHQRNVRMGRQLRQNPVQMTAQRPVMQRIVVAQDEVDHGMLPP